MSWSISATGTKDEVKLAIQNQMTTQHSNYKGKPEADDIFAVSSRAHALVDAVATTDAEPNVSVSMYGTHSTDAAGVAKAEFHAIILRQAVQPPK